jgi:hypothetical protein
MKQVYWCIVGGKRVLFPPLELRIPPTDNSCEYMERRAKGRCIRQCHPTLVHLLLLQTSVPQHFSILPYVRWYLGSGRDKLVRSALLHRPTFWSMSGQKFVALRVPCHDVVRLAWPQKPTPPQTRLRHVYSCHLPATYCRSSSPEILLPKVICTLHVYACICIFFKIMNMISKNPMHKWHRKYLESRDHEVRIVISVALL